jgi:DNA adenine methylase
MNAPLNPIQPAQPIAPWLGGKRNLAKRICYIIDATPCSTYAEPFVGMGGIFLRRGQRPKAEVINDYGRDVANLFEFCSATILSFWKSCASSSPPGPNSTA